MKYFFSGPRFGQENPVRSLWVLLFLNAAGTWTSWLVLGPYLMSERKGLIAFGFLALVRQLCSFLGTLLAESWPIKGRIEHINRYIEWSLVAINVIAIGCVWGLPAKDTLLWAQAWSLFRFLVGGFSIVFGYRLIYDLAKKVTGENTSKHAANSLVGQLAVGQGSVVVGSLISLLFVQFTPQITMSMALGFDMLTSLALVWWLSRVQLPEVLTPKGESPIRRLAEALRGIFTLVSRRDSVVFLLSLLSLTSLPTIFMYFSMQEGAGNLSKFYSGMNLINGCFLLFSAYKISTSQSSLFKGRTFFTIGSLVLATACVATIAGLAYGPFVFVVTALFSLGSTAALLSIHGWIMAGAPSEGAIRLRSSMALYLNLIFGSSELICAALADWKLFNVWMIVKAAAATGSLLLVWWPAFLLRRKVVVMSAVLICSLLMVHKMLQRPDNENPLTIALPSVRLETDPHKMEDIQSMFLSQQLHRSLFRFASDGTIQPDIVELAELSADRKSLAIKLKAGQTFSDFTPLTAQNVVASLQRPFTVGSSIAGDLSYLKGAESALKHKNGEELAIRASDDLHLVIELERPSELLSTHLALPDLAILKIKSSRDALSEISSGAFVIRKSTDDEMILEAWNKTSDAAVKKLRLVRINPDAAFQAALDGRIDSVEQYSFSPDQMKQLVAKGWRTSVHSLSYENFLLMNPAKVSRKVRDLISSSFLSENMVHDLGPDRITPAYGLIPSNLPGALHSPIELAEPAAVRNEKFVVNFNQNNELHRLAALWLQRHLRSLGIELALAPLRHEEFYEHLLGKKSALIIAGKGIDYPDGLANLMYFRTDVPNHFVFMENGNLNKPLSALAFLADEERIKAYQDIQHQILAQRTIVPLFFGHTTSGLWSARVDNIPSHPFGFQFLKVDEIKL